MASKQVKTPLKLFATTEPPDHFLRDLDVFFGLSPEKQEQVQKFFDARERPYASLEEREKEALISLTGLPREEVENLARAIRFLITALAGKFTIEDIATDLKGLGQKLTEIVIIKQFLNRIISHHNDIQIRIQREATANQTIDTISTLSFSVDLRAVYDTEDKNLIGCVPVIVARMRLEGGNEENEIVFQVSREKLDQLCEMLEVQRQRLAEFGNRMHFEEHEP